MNTHVDEMIHDASFRAAYAEESVRIIRADLASAMSPLKDFKAAWERKP